MTRRSHRPEQIIKKLREIEVLLSQGSTVGKAAREIGVTEQTYYRWQREYGGMPIDAVKRLKEPEPAILIIWLGHGEPFLNQELANLIYNGI